MTFLRSISGEKGDGRIANQYAIAPPALELRL